MEEYVVTGDCFSCELETIIFYRYIFSIQTIDRGFAVNKLCRPQLMLETVCVLDIHLVLLDIIIVAINKHYMHSITSLNSCVDCCRACTIDVCLQVPDRFSLVSPPGSAEMRADTPHTSKSLSAADRDRRPDKSV